ncbi:MAG: SpoIIE family protein phosphatase [Flavobacteriales bacterium]|nr:SpoIIE family protein phosphatase [Flavobacteriales bacterium]
MDEQIEQLLSESKTDCFKLIPLTARYSELLSSGNLKLIEEYAKRIEDTCHLWETETPMIRGIRLFSDGMKSYFNANFEASLQPLENAMEILKGSACNDLFAMANMFYGRSNRSLGNLDISVRHFTVGMENLDSNGEFAIFKGLGYYQLAEIDVYINDFEAAKKNYEQAANEADRLSHSSGLFRAYNGMANLFLNRKDLEQCKLFLDKSLSIEGLTVSQISRSYCDLGVYYHNKKDFINAAKSLKESYQLRMDSNLKSAASTSLINLGKTQLELEQTGLAISTLEEALGLCVKYKSNAKLMACHQLLAQAYAKNNEWKKSSKFYTKYDLLQISLNSTQLQNIYDIKNEQIQKQKAIIEAAHKEITDSISYAKRIQNAILPSEKLIQRYLKNSFMLYKPKDVVAGDFYWVQEKNETLMFAVADCTGHGVPGAMVSVVCNNALSRSVREYGLTEPGKILDQTREIVIQQFDTSKKGEVKDGMDIALCTLMGNTLKYSGANNPLWIVRKGEVLETKADKQPIGKFETSSLFTTHTLQLERGDNIYIFSDGYADQFGGEKGKKFRTKALKTLLLSLQDKKMKDQKTILNENFENWKGSLEQIDDVCIFGFGV